MRILFEIGAEPVGRLERLLPARVVSRLAKPVVVRQSPLRDRDWVVLQSDGAVVVEHRNAAGAIVPGVFSFLAEPHVVLAEIVAQLIGEFIARTGEGARRSIFFAGRKCARIDLRHLVPKGQLASPGTKVGAEDAAIVVPTVGWAHAGG